jgi:hypothetical protein
LGKDGDILLQADTSGGLWRSEDGMAWVRTMAGKPLAPLSLAMSTWDTTSIQIGQLTVAGVPNYGIYYTDTNGLTWKQSTYNSGPIPGYCIAGQLWTNRSIAFAEMQSANAVDGASTRQLWRSLNGIDWSHVTSWRFGPIATMMASGSTWMAISTGGDVRISNNQGLSWSEDKIPALKSGRVLARFADRWIAIGTKSTLSIVFIQTFCHLLSVRIFR